MDYGNTQRCDLLYTAVITAASCGGENSRHTWLLRVCFPELTVVFQEHMLPNSTCSTLEARFHLAYFTFHLMISYLKYFNSSLLMLKTRDAPNILSAEGVKRPNIIHLCSSSSSSSAYPGSGRGGSSSSRGPQTSLSRATLTSSDGGIPRRSQASVEI